MQSCFYSSFNRDRDSSTFDAGTAREASATGAVGRRKSSRAILTAAARFTVRASRERVGSSCTEAPGGQERPAVSDRAIPYLNGHNHLANKMKKENEFG